MFVTALHGAVWEGRRAPWAKDTAKCTATAIPRAKRSVQGEHGALESLLLEEAPMELTLWRVWESARLGRGHPQLVEVKERDGKENRHLGPLQGQYKPGLEGWQWAGPTS